MDTLNTKPPRVVVVHALSYLMERDDFDHADANACRILLEILYLGYALNTWTGGYNGRIMP